MTLSDVKVNAEYVITQVKGSVKRRLLDMGFTPGCKIKVSGLAPFGGTVLVRIRGFDVALRKNATDFITVEAV
ncbi:MAG: ferrous iron transport protein A [Clostridiales bacterium]|nr:ferrous iron transport protein A [Clostridiales bacterium]